MNVGKLHLLQVTKMNTSCNTGQFCGHCGRPVLNAFYIGGIAYHYECTQSPYAQCSIVPTEATKISPHAKKPLHWFYNGF